MLTTTFERDVQAFRQHILRVALQQNVQTDVLVAALADTLGGAAAQLDLRTDQVVAFDDRMESVMARAKETYLRMVATRARGFVTGRPTR